MSGRGSGSVTRAFLSGNLALVIVLALVSVVAVNWLAGRRGLRHRIDLTEKGANTLSPATAGVLARLDREVDVHVFWRGEEYPYALLAPEAMMRVFDLLQLVQVESGGRVRVHNHADASREELEALKRELKLRGFENCLVLRSGERRVVLGFRGDLVQFDLGDPRRESYRPPSIRAFVAEESLVQGLLTLSMDASARVYFAQGHGEPDLEDASETGLTRLVKTLEEDGLEAAPWRPDEAQEVPGDGTVLAVLGPDVAYPPIVVDAIVEWVEAGGRLLLAGAADPDGLDRSSVGELCDRLGMSIERGLVMQLTRDALGQVTLGDPVNSRLILDPGGMAADFPVTEPFREARRTLTLPAVHPVRMERQPEATTGYTREVLVSQAKKTWVDLPPFDYEPKQGEEVGARYPVAAVSQFFPDLGGPMPSPIDPDTSPERRIEARVFAIGGGTVFTNEEQDYAEDFGRNVFNWLASREFRLSISARDPDLRRLPRDRPEALSRVTVFTIGILPVLCLGLGFATAFRRSRGGPARKTR